MKKLMWLMAIGVLCFGLQGCETLQDGYRINDAEVISGLPVVIQQFGPYPCTTARDTRIQFTQAGTAYYRVVCATPTGEALYTVTHNPYVPRGTARNWIVQRAAY